MRLRPTDRITDLYLTLNPRHWTIGDNMEFETLLLDLEKEHGLKLEECWHEKMTLGELFAKLSAA